VPVLDGDDAESLRLRILEQEHSVYVEALQAISEGRVTTTINAAGRTVVRIAPASGGS
jgi:folate-dependent phosphoribosylglycinamide formyltransferase PurN